jgi:phosphoglycerol transferase MdoB-like AlkP superfamily enzyme
MTTDISLIKNKQLIAIEERNKQQKELLDTTIALVKKTCSLGPIPKFVYGHFMTTHDPYIFDSTGKVLGGEQALAKNKKNEAKDYINQVKVADSIINELVQHIKQTNKQNTIIIVTGDHGFPTEIINRSGYSFDMFSAFYFPDQQYVTLNDSIQPINYFRIILNKFFKTNYPLLRDSSVVVTTETELIKKGTSIK